MPGIDSSNCSSQFLSRLRRNTAGNVMVISAAAIPMMLLLIGGGVDMSRAYMTKSSLQSACDAGVLAGRRAMSKTGVYDTAEKASANEMFNFNFQKEAAGAQNIAFSTVANDDGSVVGTATTDLPTVVMDYVGKQKFALSTTCSAELQMASADVMFVLDTTLSMICTPAQGEGCMGDQGSSSKMSGLKAALRDFYKTVAGAVIDKDNTRIRFGFVPYAMGVNAKGLLTAGDLPASYIADSHDYQTKLANYNTPVYVGTPGSPVASTETYASKITASQCSTGTNTYANNKYPSSSGTNPVNAGTAPANTTATTYSFKSWTKTSGSGSSALGTCVRNKSVVTTTYVTKYQFTNYRYIKDSISTAGYKGFGATSYVSAISNTSRVDTAGLYDMVQLAGVAGATGLTISNDTWKGCIEERATVSDATMDPVPSGATDLDIDSAPSDDATRWKPLWPKMEIDRGTSNPVSLDTTTSISSESDWCTAGQMKKFTDVDIANPNTVPSWLDSYITGLTANGYTYHDTGMIWGGRLGSPDGIMAANVNEGTISSVSRHIIYMTDGLIKPQTNEYSAYGLEWYDHRVAPSGTDSTALKAWHTARFLAACQAAKDKGYVIWVISFGLTVSADLTTCSTGGRAYTATDTTALQNTFRFIAGEVADLRLNQ